LTNGALSILGNLVFMRLLVGSLGFHYLLANLVTIAICSLLNFIVSDRLVFGMPAAAMLFLAGSAVSEELPPQSVLAEMASASKALRTLEAELVQVKSYPQLSIVDPEERGHLYVERTEKKGTRLLLTIVAPEPRSLVLDDGEYVFYQPKIKQALIGKLGTEAAQGKMSFLRYLLGDLTAAEEDFDILSLGEELVDGKETVRLRLNAKPGSESPYSRIDLWVRRDLSLPVRQELTELNRSVTRIELKKVSINEKIDGGVFRLELPRDVERVRG
jgi:outer membrane lipoprotein-sorting protein